jgi:hypothetical protein
MPKRKIYHYMAISFIVFLTIVSVNVKANPPQDMTLEYNSNTNILEVSITHAVADNTTHYIFSIIVSVNGSVDQSHGYDSQPDLIYFVYNYSLVTNNGSVISVTASCSEGGSLTKTLGGTSTPPDGIPGYMGMYLVLSASVITLLMLIRKKLKKV